MSERIAKVERGEWYRWEDVSFCITRVARNGSWADIAVYEQSGASWRKRQPMPLPEGSRRAHVVDPEVTR